MLLMLLIAAAALDTASLKSDFRLQAARAGRGFSATPSARSKVSRLAADLEETQRASIVELAPTSSELLLGKWYLDWTDAADVLSLALLPNVALGDIVQEIARDQTTGTTLWPPTRSHSPHPQSFRLRTHFPRYIMQLKLRASPSVRPS